MDFHPGLPLTMIGEKLGRKLKGFGKSKQRFHSNNIFDMFLLVG